MNSFIRNEQLLGKEIVEEIKNKKVVVLGLGGVGGICLEELVRLGFQNLTIVDFDSIEESNLNRQIIATKSNIGKSKCAAFSDRIFDINKDCKLTIYDEKITEENISNIITKDTDYIVDCIDDIKAKLAVYKYALENKIKIISSMGMANKIDPSRVKIDKLSNTTGDKLAKKIRTLCKENKINTDKIKAVYSDEPAYTKIEKDLPSIVLVPTTAGVYLAYYILKEILKNK